MSEKPFVKLTLCADVEEKEEVEAVENWLKKWKNSLKYFKETGCGCCVLMYDVLAPAESENDLPSIVLAGSNWTRD